MNCRTAVSTVKLWKVTKQGCASKHCFIIRITQREDGKQMPSQLFRRQSDSYYAFTQKRKSYILSNKFPSAVCLQSCFHTETVLCLHETLNNFD